MEEQIDGREEQPVPHPHPDTPTQRTLWLRLRRAAYFPVCGTRARKFFRNFMRFEVFIRAR
jgi:hypothetical protein